MSSASFTPKFSEDLNQVFLLRKKVGSYKSIPLEIKSSLMELFLKNPYPPRDDLVNLSHKHQVPLIQIQNWFKYQRKRDFHHGQKAVKHYRRKHKFEKDEREILEKAFRMNNSLEDNTILKLQKILNCSETHIKRWFYYRNKKLVKIQEKIPKVPISSSQINANVPIPNQNIQIPMPNMAIPLQNMPFFNFQKNAQSITPPISNPFVLANCAAFNLYNKYLIMNKFEEMMKIENARNLMKNMQIQQNMQAFLTNNFAVKKEVEDAQQAGKVFQLMMENKMKLGCP